MPRFLPQEDQRSEASKRFLIFQRSLLNQFGLVRKLKIRNEKKKKMAEVPNLPVDIIREILLRLPVKSLLRFRCVCKDWGCLINDSFITAYRSRSKERQPFLILTDRTTFYTVGDYSIHKFDIPFLTSTEFGDYRREVAVVGSSDGLLCFLLTGIGGIHYRDSICLLNPAIRKFKKLPHAPCEISHYITTQIGFGFDPMSNDYKVVKIVYYYEYGYRSMIMQSNVWVYSLNSDNWRNLGDISVPNLSDDSSRRPVVNAAIHWLVNRKNGLGSVSSSIFSFDLAHEVFGELPPPPDNGCYKDIMVMGGCLSVFCNCCKLSSDFTEIWVMKEYGVEESWTKQFIVIGSYPCDYTPVGFWNDEILFQHDHKTLVVYNTKGKAERISGIYGLPIDWEAFTHTESLIMLRGSSADDAVNNPEEVEEMDCIGY